MHPRTLSLCTLLATLASAGHAFAQAAPAQAQPVAPASPPPPAPAVPAPTPALAPPPAEPVACDAQGPEELLAAARVHFSAGQEMVERSAWADAERELRLALRYFDSPNARLLLGTALAGRERFDEAYNAFDSTIELAARCSQSDQTRGRAGRYEQTVADALRERDALTPRVSLLGVRVGDEVPRSVQLRVNGVVVPRAAWGRLRAYPPGDARVLAEAAGYRRFTATTGLDPRQARWVDVALAPEVTTPPPPPPPDARALALTAGGVVAGAGALALLSGGAAYGVGHNAFLQAQRDCVAGCAGNAEVLRRIDAGQPVETAGVALLWTGAAVGAAGVAVLLWGATLRRPEARAVSVLPNPAGGMVLHGRF